MAFKQEVNVPLLFTIATMSAVVLVVLILGTQAWFESSEESESAAKVEEAPRGEFAELKEQQKRNIEKIGWKDSSRTTVTIPIEDAMVLLVKNNGILPTTKPSTQSSAQPTVQTGTQP